VALLITREGEPENASSLIACTSNETSCVAVWACAEVAAAKTRARAGRAWRASDTGYLRREIGCSGGARVRSAVSVEETHGAGHR